MATAVPRPSDRREAILAAALDAFLRKGVAAATIDDVRAASGASVGSIYHHFGGKEELAAALYVEALRSYQAGVLDELNRGRSARTTVHGIVRHHLRWIAEHPDLARYLFTQREPEVLLASRAPLRELNRALFARVREWIDEQARAGAIRRLPFDVFHAVVLGPAQEFARHWLAGRAETSLAAAERSLAAAAWNSVRKEIP
jgi:AcrR family transcriptional regulator